MFKRCYTLNEKNCHKFSFLSDKLEDLNVIFGGITVLVNVVILYVTFYFYFICYCSSYLDLLMVCDLVALFPRRFAQSVIISPYIVSNNKTEMQAFLFVLLIYFIGTSNVLIYLVTVCEFS